MSNDEFMTLAIEEGRQAALEEEVPIGAVLVDSDGRVLAKAHNQTISLCDPTAHAEILAIRSAAKKMGNYRLVNTTLYVTIEPCAMCMGALLHARVTRLVFGAHDLKGGAAGSCFNLHADPRLNHTIHIENGICEKECKTLMQDFFRAKR